MRIAYLCADRGVNPAGCSGSSAHVREMVKALVARGHHVEVILAAGDGAAAVLPCPVVDLQADATLGELRSRLVRAARTGPAVEDPSHAPAEAHALLANAAVAAALDAMDPPPDVVYERQSLWCTAGLDHARRRGIPHLLEVNAPLVEQELEYRRLELVTVATAIQDFLLAGSDRVLVTSPALVDHARAHGASRRDVRVVPCGVPSSLLAGEGARDGRDPSRFVVGFVGSLKPWHGVDVLLRAFRKLHAADPGYRLLLVGDGPERGTVENYLRAHRLDEFAELTGNVDPGEVAGHLARMDAGVAAYPELPSFYFSPLKIWEYAAAGVPVVASAVGELPRLFPHREAALLHPAGSAGKLAAHIEQLRSQPELAARLARRARQVARRHTWDRLAARVESIATGAMRSSRRSG